MNRRNRIKRLESQIPRADCPPPESLLARIDRYTRELEAGAYPPWAAELERRFGAALEAAARREESPDEPGRPAQG